MIAFYSLGRWAMMIRRTYLGAVCAMVLVVTLGMEGRAQSFRDASGLIVEGQGVSGVLFGASAVDINSDGLVDLYSAGRVYLQQSDGTFRDERAEAGLLEQGEAVFGAIFGDYDGDGFLDAFMEDLRPPSLFFRNRGNGTFREANVEANLTTGFVLAQGSAWGDFNNDGRLDLFIGSDDGVNLLFLNEDNQRFRNASSGITYERNSYGVATSDYDQDGDLDIFIAACNSADPVRSIKVLMRNDGTGTFTDVASNVGLADSLASWGTVWLDVDNDGRQDLFVANMPVEGRGGANRLYWNDGTGQFLDIAGAAGVAGDPGAVSQGGAAADFDNDGWIDLIVANTQPPQLSLFLYRNQGRLTFAPIDLGEAFAEAGAGAVAVADINDDGWIDLYTPEHNREVLWLNEGGANHWLKVKTRGTASNRFGVGAWLDLYTGGQRQVREITAGDGMTSQNHDLTAHFGLGARTQVDSLFIRWPSGAMDRLQDVAGDQTITVVEGEGIDQPPARFRLTAPANGSEVSSAETEITFTWEAPADPDSEALTYTFHLTAGPDVEVERTGLTEPRAVLAADELPLNQPLRWTASASDGATVRASVDRFTVTRTVIVAAEDPPEVPAEPLRVENYPNPFRAATTLHVTLPRPARVKATVYDLTGRAVRTLVEEVMPGGEQQIGWDGQDLQGRSVAPGLYLVRIEADGARQTHPIVRVR